ncbi:MAG: NADH-quinone oxidoreductase subunit D, partial [Flavobacteriales bacterium]
VIGVDTGALTGFTYVFQEREKIYDLYEEVCGARLTTNIGRIGGFERDFSPRFIRLMNEFLKNFPAKLDEFDRLLTRNRIFMDRTIGAGPISADRALAYSFAGPNLRAAGVDYDVRVMNPYCSYQDFDFVVPIGQHGDTYDRFVVRQEEMRQSINIIKKAWEGLPEGKFHSEVPGFYLPDKPDVYSKMEALIYHFKVVMGETPIPKGEVYFAVEGANGELGYYLISDGGRTPYRLHFRRPCFIYYQAYPEMITGQVISDAVVTLSSLNVIAGELDA